MQQGKDSFFELYRKRLEDHTVAPDENQWDFLLGRIRRRRRLRIISYSTAAVFLVLLTLTLQRIVGRNFFPEYSGVDPERLAMIVPPDPEIDSPYASPVPLVRKRKEPVSVPEVRISGSKPDEMPEEGLVEGPDGEPDGNLDGDPDGTAASGVQSGYRKSPGKTDVQDDPSGAVEFRPDEDRSAGRRQLNFSLAGTSSMVTRSGNVQVPEMYADTHSSYNSLVIKTGHSIPYTKNFIFNNEYDYHYHFPISFGVSVKFGLPEDFALETGVFATKLATDVLTRQDTHIGTLEFWYIGLPLKAAWNFFSSRYFQLYLSAGGTVEKCISFSSVQINTSLQTRDIPWLFSVNAGAGMQFNIIPPVSIFLEPGLSYSFDKKNPLPTIRRERPFNFNLQGGLRFNIAL